MLFVITTFYFKTKNKRGDLRLTDSDECAQPVQRSVRYNESNAD